ncbi:LuxR C-terminal-related transcriptional regulator [Nocardioides sp. J54]|uniref:LuxR C-terminal-related transcriptional regulator n=1 Tax=Nocardioides sp. J54 TaxID=935866 RepID=UPI0004AFFB3C|nr:LuxR C-terminal-related transcriptional regulator [Nocardioides sp. J54]
MTALPESASQHFLAPAERDLPKTSMVRRVGRALDDLRALTTVQQLVQRAPAALCRVGFDRAMISRVADSEWVVERFHSELDPEQAARITEMAKANNQRLGPNVIELEMVRRRVPLLVLDVQRDPRVHPQLARMTGSSSYVAAPVAPENEVVGFIHADRVDGVVTEFDREIVALFAQELGTLVAAANMRERLEQLRVTVDNLRSSLGGMVNGCLSGPVGLEPVATVTPIGVAAGAPVQMQQQTFASSPEIDRLLSEREREVLRLMALGETNGRIASRLVITEGTVKSHVRHILRKLNAANRAEAVCRWLQRPGAPV